MRIIQKIEDFLFDLFPDAKTDKELLKEELIKYYTYGPYKPQVEIKDDVVVIDIDTSSIVSQQDDFNKTVALCEKGKYSEAKKILDGLIKKNPTNSEYYRIYGQALSEEGDHEEAINYLIDALKWDPKNNWALTMMGNIFAKYKDDAETAMKYYDQSLKVNPQDAIAANNIGGSLLQQGKIKEAKKYLWQAFQIDSKYPNTHYALGLIAKMEGDLQSAFFSSIEAIKTNSGKNGLYQNSMKQAFSAAQKIIKTDTGRKLVEAYSHELESRGGVKIETVTDENIPTAAKLELAENYNRDKHVIRYKPNFPAIEHLKMHELVHLDFFLQARKEKTNQLFVSTQNEKAGFLRSIEPAIKKLNRMGYDDKTIAGYSTALFDGINRQIFNTPIDLFIEDFLYNEYAELRPYQFISLYTLVQEGLKAVTDKRVAELSPKDILSKSKIYNLVSATQFKNLYGIDFINDFKATPNELKQAQGFYNEFLEYKNDRKPGEEYELVQHWGEDLKLDKNYELIDEETYRNKRTNLDNLIESIEKDPFDLEATPFKEKETEKFLKSQEAIGTNMAVVMFMVDAFQFFEGMPKEEIKKIAFEIAMYGTQGYSPDKKDYSIPSIPNKQFSSYHILAYYYVSWMLAVPEMVAQLQLPYDDEYKLAISMYKPKQ